MKSKLAILALVLVCLWGRVASADTITTGNLSFICTPSCNDTPTNGSFAFDNTTNQFLSFTTTWDGMDLVFANTPGNGQRAYLDLIGASPIPLSFFFICNSENLPTPLVFSPCGMANFYVLSEGFAIPYLLVGGPTSGSGGNPAFFDDGAAGVVTATDLVTTPEPATASLLLLGIGAIGLLYTASKGLTAAA
jgi:hypothetical protein